MARRKRRTSSRRSHASYVKAGRKAARTRKRRGNPWKPRSAARKHRPVVYVTGRGRSKRLRRSPRYRLRPRRVNPTMRSYARKYFGQARMMNAVMLLAGLGGSAFVKGFTGDMIAGPGIGEWYKRLYGALSIAVGATVNMQGRRKETKALGTGMVVFGLYDLLVSNVPQLGAFLPVISPPTFAGGYMSYGRTTYDNNMGASINEGDVEVVGANISAGIGPEIVGEELDLADALEMSV